MGQIVVARDPAVEHGTGHPQLLWSKREVDVSHDQGDHGHREETVEATLRKVELKSALGKPLTSVAAEA